MNEIERFTETVCAGLGVPKELLTGDTRYSGCSISLKCIKREQRAADRIFVKVFRFYRAVEGWGMRATAHGFKGRALEAVKGLRLMAEHFEDWGLR